MAAYKRAVKSPDELAWAHDLFNGAARSLRDAEELRVPGLQPYLLQHMIAFAALDGLEKEPNGDHSTLDHLERAIDDGDFGAIETAAYALAARRQFDDVDKALQYAR